MKNNALSISAFAILIVAVAATVILMVFSKAIRNAEWIDMETAAFACFGLSILGWVLGWCSFKRPLGRMTAILGTIVVAGFLFQLLRSGGGPPAPVNPPQSEAVAPTAPPESN